MTFVVRPPSALTFSPSESAHELAVRRLFHHATADAVHSCIEFQRDVVRLRNGFKDCGLFTAKPEMIAVFNDLEAMSTSELQRRRPDGPIAKAYRVARYPASFLLDADGRITARDLREESELITHIERVMKQVTATDGRTKQ